MKKKVCLSALFDSICTCSAGRSILSLVVAIYLHELRLSTTTGCFSSVDIIDHCSMHVPRIQDEAFLTWCYRTSCVCLALVRGYVSSMVKVVLERLGRWSSSLTGVPPSLKHFRKPDGLEFKPSHFVLYETNLNINELGVERLHPTIL